jgi:putative transcription factor
MCGGAGPLARAVIEGVEMSVCNACSAMGKVLVPAPRAEPKKGSFSTAMQKPKPAPHPVSSEPDERLIDNFAEKMRHLRERSGLTQKDFAAKICERETIVSKIESGSYQPPIEVVRRWEKILHARLIESDEEKGMVIENNKDDDDLTIGDIIKVKK